MHRCLVIYDHPRRTIPVLNEDSKVLSLIELSVYLTKIVKYFSVQNSKVT